MISQVLQRRFGFGAAVLTTLLVIASMRKNAMPQPMSPVAIIKGHSQGVSSLIFSPNGTLLASGSVNSVKVWNVSSNTLLKELKPSLSGGNKIAFSPNGKSIAVGGGNSEQQGSLELWDLQKGSSKWRINQDEYPLNGVVFSPDGTHLLVNGKQASIEVRDAHTGALLKRLYNDKNIYVAPITFSHDGTLFASAAGNGTVVIWSATTNKILHKLQIVPLSDLANPRSANLDKTITSLAFSPNDEFIVVGNRDAMNSSVQFWNARTGVTINKLMGVGSVEALSFSPDGHILAVADGSGKLTLYDAHTFLSRLVLAKQSGRLSILSLVFSPNGRYLAAGFLDGTIKIWQIDL